jgi:hypothetical protein
MTPNPLLEGNTSGPVQTCPTGWHDMRLPRAGIYGHDEITLRASGVLRVYEPDLNTSPRVVARLYHPKGGDVAGMFTDRGEYMMLGKAGKRSKLMADAAGVELLKGKLPWAAGPVKLAPGTLLGAMGMEFYPFSTLSHVVVTGPMPSDLLDAMVKAYRMDNMMKYGGLPVLGCPEGADAIDLGGLELVRWPEGITVLATGEKLADQISDQIFDVEVEVL